MSRVYVGSLDPRVTERDLEDEFGEFGVLTSVWVARRPPGYAFVEFDNRKSALSAIRALDGKNGWRVELSHSSAGGRVTSRGGRGGGEDMKCYECGEPGHFARECRLRVGSRGSGRNRSPLYPRSPVHRRSPAYGRSRSRRSPSPRRRSVSPPARRVRSRSRSPRERHDEYSSPNLNGNSSRSRRSPSPRRRSVTPPPRRARGQSQSPPESRDQYSSPNSNGPLVKSPPASRDNVSSPAQQARSPSRSSHLQYDHCASNPNQSPPAERDYTGSDRSE